MKKTTLILLILSILLANESISQVKKNIKHFGKEITAQNITPEGYIRCLTEEYEDYLQSVDPKRLSRDEFEAWLAPLVAEQELLQQVSSQSGGIIYIPVVVHVIHNGDAYGTNENITDEQVQSQITVMTQDFRRMLGTPGFNTNPVGADVQIEFVLAKEDPNGNPTNGINRVNLCEASWSTGDINSIVKPQTIWDPTLYMNMWSVNFTDSGLLGYAQFPSNSTLSGLAANGGSANTDGVVAGYRFFGSSDLAAGNYSAPFDKGRTMTHEVGHYLGLRHIWGDGNCSVDDFCADTPNAGAPNGGCPVIDSCPGGGNDMVQNYMDYTNDSCMNIFTQNQKTRMITVMNNSPRRSSLKTSTKDLPIPLFANDAEVIIENYCSAAGNACSGNTHQIILYNRGTSNLTSASINYNVNGGTNSTLNWTGNLAPNKYEIITVSTPETSGTFNVSVAGANGGADQRASNNNNSKAFNFPAITPPTDYPYTAFTFNLIGDPFGDETSWELRDGSNNILFSGGPYTFTGVAGTQVLVNNQVWNLTTPDCFTFTIFDSFGDGLGGSSNGGIPNGDQGSWEIRTNSGTILVGAGGDDFGTSQTLSFTNISLNNDDFSLFNSISIYPNPAKNKLNIVIPNLLNLDGSYQIYNTLGQVIATRKISTQNDLSIDVSNLSNGVYMINLTLEGQNKVLKFIKE